VLGRESFRCVTTGVAVTYGGVLNPGRAGGMVLPVFSMNAFCRLRDGFISLDRKIQETSGNPHFLHFERPLVAGVAKGTGWLKAAENTSALDHILSRVFRSNPEPI